MKKKFTSPEYKRYNQRRAENRLERSLEHKEWRRNRNRLFSGISIEEKKRYIEISRFTRVIAPAVFSFIKQPNETIEFIKKLQTLMDRRKKTFVNLSEVSELDYTAVTVLVSVMFNFKSKRIKFQGNFPKDPTLRKRLDDSDFFKYLRNPVSPEIEYAIGKENQIFTRANKMVNPGLGKTVMIEASTTIWGTKRVCKGLQRVLLELMQNTHNHADLKEKGIKYWWLSVNHDKELNKVSFVFVDYGVGVFESIFNKQGVARWFKAISEIKAKLKYGRNYEILKTLMEGQLHKALTGAHFRGKGLPGIKQVADRNQISNLHLISNDAFANVSNDNYFSLNASFSGTFIYWELNKKNGNIEWPN